MTTILPRRGTAAQWTAANPVLAMGEEGYETDTTRWKRGDGVTAWTALAYYQPSWNDVTAKPAVIAAGADQAAARAAIGAGTSTSLNAAIEGGLDNTGASNVRSALNSLVQTVNGARPIYFPKGRYRLGDTGAVSGENSITLTSGTKITADPGAVFEINQIDYQSKASIFRATGADGPKQALTTDSLAGAQTVALPTGVAATFGVGDLIGFESRAISVSFEGYESGTNNTYTKEIAKVEYIDGNSITLDRPLHFAYLIADSAEFWKITPVRDVVIENIVFEPGPGVTPGDVGQRTNAIRFFNTLNCRVSNVHIKNMIGGIDLHDAYDTRIDNLTVDRLPRQDSSIGSSDGGYGVVARGATTNLMINSYMARDCRHAFTTLPDLRSFLGTAQNGGTSNTVVLDAGASSVDEFYTNGEINITSGAGVGQVKKIIAYNGATKTATVNTNWSTTPNSTSGYSIYIGWGGPMYVKINDSIGYGGSNGGTAIWDTHEQGWFVEFNNCTAIGGDPDRNPSGTGAVQNGFQIRSAHTKITNPKIYYVPRYGISFNSAAVGGMVDGGEIAYGGDSGILVQASNVTIKGVDIHHNDGDGTVLSAIAGMTVDDALIQGCRIYENNDYGIGSSGSNIVRPLVLGCFIPKSAIQIGAINANSPTGIVKDCIMPGFGSSGDGIGAFNIATGFIYSNCYGDNGALSNKPMVAPRISSGDALRDANGARWIDAPTAIASAVNYIRISNSTAGSGPSIGLFGTDTNINLGINLKGTGYLGFNTPSASDVRLNAAGTPADVGFNFTTKGTGVVKANGVSVATKLTGAAVLDFGSVAAQSSADLTITVTGAALGDSVALGVPTEAITAGIMFTAWVSAANTVTVRAHNYTAGPLDPASGTFKATIVR